MGLLRTLWEFVAGGDAVAVVGTDSRPDAILILEHDRERAARLATVAEEEGCAVAVVASDAETARAMLRRFRVTVAVSSSSSEWRSVLGVGEEPCVEGIETPTDDELRARLRGRVCG